MSHITTLIPAYKKDFLTDVFLGLRRQSFKDFEVIVSDDSPGNVITDMIRAKHWGALTDGLHLTVVQGPKNARRNHEQLLDLWAGRTPLVHFHLDDDILYPEFYRTHVHAHSLAPCCATVSQRWLSHADGMPAWTLPLPDFVQQCEGHLLQLSREELFASTVGHCDNWLGELSNIVFSAEGAARYPRPPSQDLSYYALLDIGALLAASEHQPVTVIREYLSVFRQHEQQTTQQMTSGSHGGRIGFLAWITYALAAWRDGLIEPALAVQAIGIATRRIVQHFPDSPEMAPFFHILDTQATSLDQLYLAYRDFWLQLLASHPGTSPAPTRAPAVLAPMEDLAPHTQPADEALHA
jgi:hypothetical protein